MSVRSVIVFLEPREGGVPYVSLTIATEEAAVIINDNALWPSPFQYDSPTWITSSGTSNNTSLKYLRNLKYLIFSNSIIGDGSSSARHAYNDTDATFLAQTMARLHQYVVEDTPFTFPTTPSHITASIEVSSSNL